MQKWRDEDEDKKDKRAARTDASLDDAKAELASDILNSLDFNIECEYLFSHLDANSKYIPTKAYMMLTMIFPCRRQLHQYLCKDCVTVATKIPSVKCVHCQTDHPMKDVAIRFDLLNQPKV